MKFRTEIKIEPFARQIDYAEPILLLGSCFADEMREQLLRLKFHASGNFGGPLFNPSSIAAAVRCAELMRPISSDELHQTSDKRWFHFDTNTLSSHTDPKVVVARCNEAQQRLHDHLTAAKHVVVTFGTAWIYRLRETGQVVANCHKQPATLFDRQRLTVDEIVEQWSTILTGVLATKQVILTVSPIRHLGDGLSGNCLSKSTLRLAAEELAQRFENVCYFPAYEILTDDLRDYRFYAEDMVHPSRHAVEYIWELFRAAALTPHSQSLIPQVEQIIRMRNHRPHHPIEAPYRELCNHALACIAEVLRCEKLDFSEEIDWFNRLKSQ